MRHRCKTCAPAVRPTVHLYTSGLGCACNISRSVSFSLILIEKLHRKHIYNILGLNGNKVHIKDITR